MRFFAWLFRSKRKLGQSNRLYVKDVQPGERVFIESNRFLDRIALLKCLSNDPKTKKILLEIKWSNPGTEGLPIEKIILDYNSSELENFHLLNSAIQIPVVEKKKESITFNVNEMMLTKWKHIFEKRTPNIKL